ncbi:MAG: transglutaminase domain-containing protein [Deltaproteobacteria bacterium]|nr:transglutaminase domain-containing protein [Deltaproteobacteria bacterium]
MATYPIKTLIQNAGIQKDPLAEAELEDFLTEFDADGDGKLTDEEWQSAVFSDMGERLFGNESANAELRHNVFRNISQRFAADALSAGFATAAKNGASAPVVRYASDELNPFLNQLTDAEIGDILADPQAFRQYVIAQGLQSAFFEINDNLVYDEGMSVDEFYEILGSVFDEAGNLRTEEANEYPETPFNTVDDAYAHLQQYENNLFQKGLDHLDNLLQDRPTGVSDLNARLFSAYVRGLATGKDQAYKNVEAILTAWGNTEGGNVDLYNVAVLTGAYSRIIGSLDYSQRQAIKKTYAKYGVGAVETDWLMAGELDKATQAVVHSLLQVKPDMMDQLAVLEGSDFFQKNIRSFFAHARGLIESALTESIDTTDPASIYDRVAHYQTGEGKKIIYGELGLSEKLVDLADNGESQPRGLSDRTWKLAQAVADSRRNYTYREYAWTAARFAGLIGLSIASGGIAGAAFGTEAIAAGALTGAVVGGAGAGALDIYDATRNLNQAQAAYYSDVELTGAGSRAYVETLEEAKTYAVANAFTSTAAGVALAPFGGAQGASILYRVGQQALVGSLQGTTTALTDGRVMDSGHAKKRLIQEGEEDQAQNYTPVYGVVMAATIGAVMGGGFELGGVGVGKFAKWLVPGKGLDLTIDFNAEGSPAVVYVRSPDGESVPVKVIGVEGKKVTVEMPDGSRVSLHTSEENIRVLTLRQTEEWTGDEDTLIADKPPEVMADRRSRVALVEAEVTQAGPRDRRSAPKFADHFTAPVVHETPPALQARLADLRIGESLSHQNAEFTRTSEGYEIKTLNNKPLYVRTKNGKVYEFFSDGSNVAVHTPNGGMVMTGENSILVQDGDTIFFSDPRQYQERGSEPIAMTFRPPKVDKPAAVPPQVRADAIPRRQSPHIPPKSKQAGLFRVGQEDVLVRDEAGKFVFGYWKITKIKGDQITLTDKNVTPARTITVSAATLESWQRVTTMTIESGELWIAGDKTKYAGKLEFFMDTGGTNKVRVIDERTGREKIVPLDSVVGYRPRGEDLTAQFSRVADPQFPDKSVNKSGLGGEGQWVLVDFSDPKLVTFLQRQMDPIYADLQSGRITPEEAATRAREVISREVRFDEFGDTPDNLVNLAEFLDQGVCNEMAMLLQVSLQYLGIGSRMRKGNFGEGGRHAWVELDRPGAKPLILDPAKQWTVDPTKPDMEELYSLYHVDRKTPFDQPPMKTVAIFDTGSGENSPSLSPAKPEVTEAGVAPEARQAVPAPAVKPIPFPEGSSFTVYDRGNQHQVKIRDGKLWLVNPDGAEMGPLGAGRWTLRDSQGYPVGEFDNGNLVAFDETTQSQMRAVQETLSVIRHTYDLSVEHNVKDMTDLEGALEALDANYRGVISQSRGLQSEVDALRADIEGVEVTEPYVYEGVERTLPLIKGDEQTVSSFPPERPPPKGGGKGPSPKGPAEGKVERTEPLIPAGPIDPVQAAQERLNAIDRMFRNNLEFNGASKAEHREVLKRQLKEFHDGLSPDLKEQFKGQIIKLEGEIEESAGLSEDFMEGPRSDGFESADDIDLPEPEKELVDDIDLPEPKMDQQALPVSVGPRPEDEYADTDDIIATVARRDRMSDEGLAANLRAIGTLPEEPAVRPAAAMVESAAELAARSSPEAFEARIVEPARLAEAGRLEAEARTRPIRPVPTQSALVENYAVVDYQTATREFHGKTYEVHQFQIPDKADQVQFLTDQVQGLTPEQAGFFLEEVRNKGGNFVISGSRFGQRARFDKTGVMLSDLDVGFSGLNGRSQVANIVKKFNRRFSGNGPDIIEHNFIYPGYTSKSQDSPLIESPEEFFMRTGIRSDGPYQGLEFQPYGYLSMDAKGNVELLVVPPSEPAVEEGRALAAGGE